ncbi:hypothetical protein PEC301899_11300 [Pectobacterium carotovorum subsp. carotovorum]|nr:hypothetical protein PEC301899_11300 [Pectobacterium carotovorum subsp. carotovorum]
MEQIYRADKSVNPEKNLAVIKGTVRIWQRKLMALPLPCILVNFVRN